MARKITREFADALLEMAEGMHRIGLLDDRTYRRIIVRLLGEESGSRRARRLCCCT